MGWTTDMCNKRERKNNFKCSIAVCLKKKKKTQLLGNDARVKFFRRYFFFFYTRKNTIQIYSTISRTFFFFARASTIEWHSKIILPRTFHIELFFFFVFILLWQNVFTKYSDGHYTTVQPACPVAHPHTSPPRLFYFIFIYTQQMHYYYNNTPPPSFYTYFHCTLYRRHF